MKTPQSLGFFAGALFGLMAWADRRRPTSYI
jgi:hypothetical protein